MTNRPGRLQAIHSWHLHVHQHQIKIISLHRFHRFTTVVRHHHAVPTPLKELACDLLVDDAVLGEQDAQRAPAFGGLRWRDGRRAERLLPRAQGSYHRITQIGVLDRLDQVVGNTQLLAAGLVLRLPSRRQHHQNAIVQFRAHPDALREHKAIHIGHHDVQQCHAERCAACCRGIQFL